MPNRTADTLFARLATSLMFVACVLVPSAPLDAEDAVKNINLAAGK